MKARFEDNWFYIAFGAFIVASFTFLVVAEINYKSKTAEEKLTHCMNKTWAHPQKCYFRYESGHYGEVKEE